MGDEFTMEHDDDDEVVIKAFSAIPMSAMLIGPSCMSDGGLRNVYLMKVFSALPHKKLFTSYATVKRDSSNSQDERKALKLSLCSNSSAVDCCYTRIVKVTPKATMKHEVLYHNGYRTLKPAGFVFNDPTFEVPPGDILVDKKMLQENQGIPWLEALQDVNRKKYMSCLTFCELVIYFTSQRPYYSPYPYEVICMCMETKEDRPCNLNKTHIPAEPFYKLAVENAIKLLKSRNNH